MKDNLIISMSKFLYVYYNFEGDVFRKVTHNQINSMLSIGNISNDKIADEDISSGKVILVRDCEGTIQGYKNPLINKKDFTDEEPLKIDVTFDEKPSIDIQNLSSYNNYELVGIIKECKKRNNDRNKNIVIKELHKRKELENNHKEEIIEKVRRRELRKE
jgi:hypothetical protein